jgi:hypothetical protein
MARLLLEHRIGRGLRKPGTAASPFSAQALAEAVDPASGHVLWRQKLAAAGSANPAACRTGYGVLSR